MDIFYTKANNVKVNLTKMFGKGNEPTPEEFESMFPSSYYTYEEDDSISEVSPENAVKHADWLLKELYKNK